MAWFYASLVDYILKYKNRQNVNLYFDAKKSSENQDGNLEHLLDNLTNKETYTEQIKAIVTNI